MEAAPERFGAASRCGSLPWAIRRTDGAVRFLDGISWRLASRLAARNRRRFGKLLIERPWRSLSSRAPGCFPAEIVSFSGARDLPEQVLSMLSFLRQAGAPTRWTLYSDGSHSEKDGSKLGELDECIRLREWNANGVLDAALERYSSRHPLGKKIAAYSSHPLAGPTLFLDSDVVFYALAGNSFRAALREGGHWYLPDLGWGALDSHHVQNEPPTMYQVNTGCFLLQPGFDWSAAVDYLRNAPGKFEYFSEQTACHVAFRRQRAMPFDPRIFIVGNKDQFTVGSKYRRDAMALRHYVAIVRHKLWEPGWEWHLR